MTEEQARTKWCPFTRVVTPTGMAAGNKASDGELRAGTYCIASDCMMWREPGSYGGHCGLAGAE